MKARCITLGDTALAGLVQRVAKQSTTPKAQAQWKHTLHEPGASTPSDRATVVLLGHVEHQRNQGNGHVKKKTTAAPEALARARKRLE